MRRTISPEVKKAAFQMRSNGFSVGSIARELRVSKSTAYEWTKSMEGAVRYAKLGRMRWIKEVQALGAQAQRKKRENKLLEVSQEIAQEVRDVSVDSLFFKKSLLAMLYWAEGSKSRGGITFANTDPRLHVLFLALLRHCYEIDESRLRIRLHLHWYHKENEVKKFWSELLEIPVDQFQKTYRKKRSHQKAFRKNIGGICFVRYNSDILRERILRFGYAVGGKLTKK